MVMTGCRYWVVACAVQIGVAGCGARQLDSVNKMPGDDAGAEAPGISLESWIAFDSNGTIGNRDIFVIRPDGTGRRQLTTEASGDAQPSFSPDGRKLAFTSDRDRGVTQIFVMDLATGLSTQVTQRAEGAHDPAFSLDGTRVGYRSGVSVFTALLDGTDERQATDGSTCCRESPFGGPVFAPDGRSIIYDDYNAIYATDGTNRSTIVMPTTGEQSHPALSPGGTSILLQATCPGDNAARSIWTVPGMTTTNFSCTGGQRLSAPGTDATHASWGPGDIVVWGSVTGGTNGSSPVPSALVASQNGTLWTLTSGSGDDRNPSWSPAGAVIGTW
jgi:Tol biopolymer transport system component